jgi:hypothetical protein
VLRPGRCALVCARGSYRRVGVILTDLSPKNSHVFLGVVDTAFDTKGFGPPSTRFLNAMVGGQMVSGSPGPTEDPFAR